MGPVFFRTNDFKTTLIIIGQRKGAIMPSKKAPPKKELVEIVIRPSSELPPTRIYSNHVEVTQSPQDFTLTFCDATPISNLDAVRDKAGIHDVPIVAEIAIPFSLVPNLIKVLQSQHRHHKKLIGDATGNTKTSK
jgi:hypothetical protein